MKSILALLTLMSLLVTTPLQAAEINWEARQAQATPAADQTLYVIMHAAVDCTYCKEWNAAANGLPAFRQWLKSHPMVKLVVVDRSSIAAKETTADYPPFMQKMYQLQLRNHALSPVTPTFEAVLGNDLLYRTVGVPAWHAKMFPAIKKIEARRLTATSDSSQQNAY